jgi:hypothetical protein
MGSYEIDFEFKDASNKSKARRTFEDGECGNLECYNVPSQDHHH